MPLLIIGNGHRRTRWHSIHQQTKLRANPKSTASRSEREAGDNRGPYGNSSAAAFPHDGERRSRGPENGILAKKRYLGKKIVFWATSWIQNACNLRRVTGGSPARLSASILGATTAARVAREVL